MRLLVLGGTRFVGAALVEDALRRGWAVTVFNRGRTGSVPEGADLVVGDRTDATDLQQLATGKWDAVVDTWAVAPKVVRDAARALRDSVGRYGYISSRSVYSWPLAMGADESAPLVDADPDADATDYAADKRGAEIALDREVGPDRVLHARAGLILGPREDIDRLPWWLRRVARGGRMLAPGPPDVPLQYIDARDLAAFVLHGIEQGLHGPYDVVSEPGHATMQQILDACIEATGSDAEPVWVDPGFLLERDVQPWTEMPIWIPPDTEDFALHTSDVSKAMSAGLRARPVAETVADTWRWMQTAAPPAPRPDRPPVGMDPEREAALLSEWDSR